jgi:fructosamine-3-kinase
MIPPALREPLEIALRSYSDSTPICRTQSVGSGCINNAHRVETEQGVYFLKWNDQPLPDMFLVEARGLELLRATNTLHVPTFITATNAIAQCPAHILMEWIENAPAPLRSGYQEVLGRQLAELHRSSAPDAYGLDHDNYLGSTPQYNGWDDDWVRFFRERRLQPQIELAQRNGHLLTARRRGLERLAEQLERWLDGVERRPSLLHGDLWGGNVLVTSSGAPALIDPAVYYGDREAELAYTELFGGFNPRFYAAYAEVWPLAAGYAERRDMYNLYHLLNHLNIFGESYGAQVDAVVRRYVG